MARNGPRKGWPIGIAKMSTQEGQIGTKWGIGQKGKIQMAHLSGLEKRFGMLIDIGGKRLSIVEM